MKHHFKKLTFSFSVIIIAIFIYQYFQISENKSASYKSVIVKTKIKFEELEKEERHLSLSPEKRSLEFIKIVEQLPDSHKKLKRQYLLAMGRLPTITFYGRLIDQFDVPVSGAIIWYSGEKNYLNSGGKQGFVKTDTEGYFSITTTGSALVVGGVTHDEIDEVSYPSGLNQHALYNERKGSMRFLSTDRKGELLNYHRYSSKDQAFIVHAWRLQGYQGTKANRMGYNLTPDGRVYTISFNQQNGRVKTLEGMHKGDLLISCKRKPIKEYLRDYGDWEFTVAAVNGGIQLTDDLYMNRAPDTGYQPSLVFRMKFDDPQYQPRLFSQRMYFHSNNERVYGSLIATLLPFREKDKCSFKANYRFNPTGSRSLELKPQKSWQTLQQPRVVS